MATLSITFPENIDALQTMSRLSRVVEALNTFDDLEPILHGASRACFAIEQSIRDGKLPARAELELALAAIEQYDNLEQKVEKAACRGEYELKILLGHYVRASNGDYETPQQAGPDGVSEAIA